MSETTTYNAFARDSADNPKPDFSPYGSTDDEPRYGPDGIAVEDAEGRTVAGKDFRWPSGKFTPESADETLGRMGFRRTGPWEGLGGGDWRAPLVADDSTAEAGFGWRRGKTDR